MLSDFRSRDITVVVLLVILIGAVLVLLPRVHTANQTPVGTPGIHTTFVTDIYSTATPEDLQSEAPSLLFLICSGKVPPTTGVFVFRIWTPNSDKELFRVNMDGTNICQLTQNAVSDDQPAISPDGTTIAFVLLDDQMRPGIFIMNADGTGRTQLTGGGSAYSFPAWSPDGQQLLFQATIDELFDLYVIHTDGTHLRNLTQDVTLDTTLAWSADGQQIAFASDRTFDPAGYVRQGDCFEIYVMNADGSDVRRLTTNERIDSSPKWSPDDQHIVFVSEAELHLINADGTGLRQLTNTADFVAHSPVWLPDGQHIVFVSDLSGAISIMDIHDLSIQQLVPAMGLAEIAGWWP